uniref:Uncharacterized protein n=1 Tax=Aegilops tauschii subsp. strangulata TaxID=200361 RepID=A0A453F2K6_AEGTS
ITNHRSPLFPCRLRYRSHLPLKYRPHSLSWRTPPAAQPNPNVGPAAPPRPPRRSLAATSSLRR